MVGGRNPFEADTATSIEGVPRLRIVEINETNVVVAVEVVEDGFPVLTFNRACLRVGDTLKLNSLSISMDVRIKE